MQITCALPGTFLYLWPYSVLSVHAVKACRVSGVITLLTLNLGNSWRRLTELGEL
jgi:hypothetical protein